MSEELIIKPLPPFKYKKLTHIHSNTEDYSPIETISQYEDDDLKYHKNESIFLPNGDHYYGEIRNGLRHGQGTYQFKSGHYYKGNWKLGLKHGIGKFYYPDGSIYEGEWKQDHRHGIGTYIYPNQDRYEGNWYKDIKHGTGYYKYHDQDVNFHGTWKNGVLQGPAEIIFNGYQFHGHYQSNQALGPCVYSFNHKNMIVGFMETSMNGTKWNAIETKLYDCNEIPQQPVSLPLIEDSMESICVSASQITIENENDEEDEEDTFQLNSDVSNYIENSFQIN